MAFWFNSWRTRILFTEVADHSFFHLVCVFEPHTCLQAFFKKWKETISKKVEEQSKKQPKQFNTWSRFSGYHMNQWILFIFLSSWNWYPIGVKISINITYRCYDYVHSTKSIPRNWTEITEDGKDNFDCDFVHAECLDSDNDVVDSFLHSQIFETNQRFNSYLIFTGSIQYYRQSLWTAECKNAWHLSLCSGLCLIDTGKKVGNKSLFQKSSLEIKS